MLDADVLGWVGSIMFAVCGVPQAWQCIKNKNAYGINSLFIFLWFLGEVFYIISVLLKFGFVSWMMFNYILNIICILVIGFYLVKDKWWRKRFQKEMVY